MNTPTTTAASTGTAIVPSTFAGMPDHALQEVTIKRGTYVVQNPTTDCPDGEHYGPGAVLLVPPEEAACLKRSGALGLPVEAGPVIVQRGVDQAALLDMAHAGAVVGRG